MNRSSRPPISPWEKGHSVWMAMHPASDSVTPGPEQSRWIGAGELEGCRVVKGGVAAAANES